MSKRLTLILSLALGIGLIASFAYAEVQNIKVGGDLTTLALTRYGFNLANPETDASGLVSVVRLRVDADLTDDVGVTVRLLNERVWGSLDQGLATTPAASAAYAKSSDEIDLDLAYVTLKEFLYSPLTLVVGRQEIHLGSELLIGDVDTNQVANAGSTVLPAGTRDLSARKSLDAIVGVLDYNPLTLTLGFAKGVESELTAATDDINVYVVNADYDFGTLGTVGQLYYVLQEQNKQDINNIGARVVSSPVDNLSVNAEYCYQTARRAAGQEGHRSDSAVLLGATYAFPDVATSPSIGIDYTRISENWNVMFENITPADIVNALLPNTNYQAIGITAQAKPMEDVTARLRYANVRVIEGISAPATNPCNISLDPNKKEVGNEVDLSFIYDYTEDVQLGLSLGYLDAGKAIASPREDATQVIGSMKVTF